MADNALLSSFMMLSEHLYSIFLQYIINGRTRAPPETDLMEMLPTFQFGAKTDRRALQSKFKSWAKRMNFKNGYLTLINSGKIIIPKERCDELIMHLHSEEHCSIEKIISQIRQNYSWTKKNFGMDRDVVVESIARNCKKEDCLKKMRLEIAGLSGSFCSSLPNSQLPEHVSKIPSQIQCISPYSYRWPLPFPVVPMFTPNAFPFQPPFLNSMYDMGNSKTGLNKTMNISKIDRKYSLNSMDNQKEDAKTREGASFSSIKFPSSRLISEKKPQIFKKPKNEYEYKDLIEAARLKPNEFPNILRSEKNKFLSYLGIVPKSLCSSRTLKRFRQELRRKKLMNRECMIYRERKILRDKNKLKKYSHERKNHFYLGISSMKDSVSTRLGKLPKDTNHKESSYLKLSKRLNSEQKEECSSKKRLKIMRMLNKEPIEIIDIATSEDETREHHLSSDKESKEGNENCRITATENQLKVNRNKKLTETTVEKLPDTQVNTQNVEENKENINKHENVDKIKFPYNDTSHITFLPFNSNEIHKAPLNPIRILLPKTTNYDSSQNKNGNFSNIPLQIRRFPPPHVVGSYAGHRSMTSSSPNNCLFPRINPVSNSIRQNTPNFQQTRGNFVLPNKNNVPRIVYPIQVPNTKGTKVLLVDSEQKGAFFLIPQYHRPILPRNPLRTEIPVTSNSQESKISNSLSSATSELRGSAITKRNAVEQSRKLIREGEKEKTDINAEMMRISKWIYRMKANLNPCMFNCGIEKSVQKLISQLDVGIYLVREAKKSLEGLKNATDVRMSSSETGK